MLIYTVKRLGVAIIILVSAITLLFLMLHLIPGDPVTIALGPRATEAMKNEFRIRMGLDQPFFIQIFNFLWSSIRGDLGTDVWSGRSVSRMILDVLPNTLALTGSGIALATLLGIPLGCHAAVRKNSWSDFTIAIFSVGVIAIPSFVVSLYMLLIFAVWLRWFPAIGAGEGLADQLWHLVLPALSIGIVWVGFLGRIVRASMIEVLNEPHVLTMQAFGVKRRRLVMNYALRIAILPTVALLGVSVGRMLTGAVLAEIVFTRPGLGKLIYDSVLERNYPVVMGGALVATALFTVSTLTADLVAARLDPRIREGM